MSWQQEGFRAMILKRYQDPFLRLGRRRHPSWQTIRKAVCCSISGSGAEQSAAVTIPPGSRSSLRKNLNGDLDWQCSNANPSGVRGDHQLYPRTRRSRRTRSGAESAFDDDRHHGGNTEHMLNNPCDNAATTAHPAFPQPLRSVPMHPGADVADAVPASQVQDPGTAAPTARNPHILLAPKLRQRHRQRLPQGAPSPRPSFSSPLGPGSGDDDGMDGSMGSPVRGGGYLLAQSSGSAAENCTVTRRHGGGHERQTSQWEMELPGGGHGGSGSSRSSSGSRGATSRSSSSRSARRNGSTSASRMDPKQINGVIMDAGTRRDVEEILQLVSEHGHYFSAVNVATALHRLGSCGLQPGSWEAKRVLTDPRFSRLLETLAEGRVQAFMPQEVSNCLWALAKLGYPSSAEKVTSSHGRGDSCSESGETGLGGGRAGGGGDEGVWVLELLCTRANNIVEDFQQQEVTNTLWALGTLGHYPGEALLRNLIRRLLQLLPETAPQGIASALLGVAKLGWNPGPGVLDRVAHGSLTQIRKFNAQALSNTLWSLARLGHYNEHLQAAIFHQALRRSSEFNPQGIANMVWAAATLGVRPSAGDVGEGGDGADDDGDRAHDDAGDDGRWRGVGFGANPSTGESQQHQHHLQLKGDIPVLLLRRFCDQAVAMLHTYTPQNVSNLLWATAKMGYRHKALLTAAADQAARQLKGGVGVGPGAPWAAVNGTGSEGDAGIGVLGDAGGGRGGRGGGGGKGGFVHWKAQEVANATWAYATLGFQPGPEYLGEVCRQLSSPQHLPGYKWQEMANTVWALATLQNRDCTAALAAVEREVLARLGGGPAIDGKQQQRRQQLLRSIRPADVSMLLWSYASLEHPAPDLFATLLPFLERRPGQFSEPELTNSVWAAATLGVYDEQLMDAVAQHICSYRLPYLHIHQVASIAWSYGKFQHAHKPLFDGLVARAVSYPVAAAAASVPISISGTDLTVLSQFVRLCCAVGVFGWRYPELLAVTTQRFRSVLAQLRDGSGDSCGGSRVALPEAAITHAVQESPAIAAARAPATASVAAAGSAAAASAAVTEAGGDGGGGAFAVVEASPLHSQRSGEGDGGVGGSGPSRENVTRAWDPPAAFEAPDAPPTARPPRAQTVAAEQRLTLIAANLSWGFSLVRGCSPEMWAQLMELMGRVVEEEGDEGEKEKEAGGARGGGGRGVLELLPDEALRQLYQAYMHVRLEHPNAVLAVGPPGLLDRAAKVWRFRSTWAAQVSQLQQQVSEALTRLGLIHSVELLIDNGDFSIDLALELNVTISKVVLGGGSSGVEGRPSSSPAVVQPPHLGIDIQDSLNVSAPEAIVPSSSSKRHGRPARRKATPSSLPTPTSTSPNTTTQVIRIAVEVDGPSHFTANTRQPLSPTLYRRRCLEDRGWVVVSVPYWRWNQCRTATSDGATSSGPAGQEEALLLQLMREEGLGEVIEAMSVKSASGVLGCVQTDRLIAC
ncbi:hypothetical protein VaNZ11_016365 [Volvox africanus]|uniref:RAP domain-containing protein n=1 Tax=Volvox africanus TaxID=51714 RepID=A0ABQ5SNM7_9CHLO|nr:hypothetical protein VaNZ11_016365 [Volvox africanus]